MRGVNPLRPPLYRFWEKIQFLESGCWEWKGALNSDGYGNFNFDGQINGAHRFAYQAFRSTIPNGYEIDHLCRNPKCVNPSHLEVVTHRENVLRGLAPIACGQFQVAKTHCPYGHDYNEENTYYRVAGGRQCRACDRLYQRRKRRTKQCE